jgi:hypothetical protein
MTRGAIVVLCTALLVGLLGGCASSQEKAQKLLGEGKYEEVVAQYPDTPAAKQAKEKIAQQLYNEGKYDEILKSYGDSPIAAKAKAQFEEQSAKKLFDAQDYEGVLKQYPHAEIAMAARDSLAQKLYGSMYSNPDGWEKIQEQYPQVGGPTRGKDLLAKEEFDKIMTMPAKERRHALQNFVQNPKFQGTLADAKARKELAKKKG